MSERAAAQGQARNLAWTDRVKLAPTRLGAYAEYHLGWRRGSVLNLLSDERADTSVALVEAAREARSAFGEQADAQLGTTLAMVEETATDLGIPYGAKVRAMLNSHSIFPSTAARSRCTMKPAFHCALSGSGRHAS